MQHKTQLLIAGDFYYLHVGAAFQKGSRAVYVTVRLARGLIERQKDKLEMTVYSVQQHDT